MPAKFNRQMLKDAKVPHYADLQGVDIDQVMCRIKLFDLSSGWEWYIAGANQEDGTCFGFTRRGKTGGEIGYFQLRELNHLQREGTGINIQISEQWNPRTSLAEVIEERTR